MARPKSASAGSPKSVTRMFAGLTSRCSTPSACASASASAILTPTSRASAGVSGAIRMRSAYDPRHSSMIRYGCPSSVTPGVEEVDDVRVAGHPAGRPRLAQEPPLVAFALQRRFSTLTATSPARPTPGSPGTPSRTRPGPARTGRSGPAPSGTPVSGHAFKRYGRWPTVSRQPHSVASAATAVPLSAACRTPRGPRTPAATVSASRALAGGASAARQHPAGAPPGCARPRPAARPPAAPRPALPRPGRPRAAPARTPATACRRGNSSDGSAASAAMSPSSAQRRARRRRRPGRASARSARGPTRAAGSTSCGAIDGQHALGVGLGRRRVARVPAWTKPRTVPAMPTSSGCPVALGARQRVGEQVPGVRRLAQPAGDHAADHQRQPAAPVVVGRRRSRGTPAAPRGRPRSGRRVRRRRTRRRRAACRRPTPRRPARRTAGKRVASRRASASRPASSRANAVVPRSQARPTGSPSSAKRRAARSSAASAPAKSPRVTVTQARSCSDHASLRRSPAATAIW